MSKEQTKKEIEKYLDDTRFIYLLSAIVGLVSFLLLVWFAYGYFSKDSNEREILEIPKEEQDECEFRRPLDGVCVESEEEKNPRLVAVMVENHVDARPQSGIASANIVYEAPVEANYSRFLLIYLEKEEIKKVGPGRSARSYYLDWVSEYGDAMYMHVGGSPEALKEIKEYSLFDINEMSRGWFFWRDENRYAPHNAYTSSKLWQKAFEDYGENNNNFDFESWKFDKIEKCEENCVNEITVSLNPPIYEAVWKFNSSTKKYARYQMGYPHKDQDNKGIFADSIIVQYVETEVLDEEGRLGMETIGNGKVVVFQNGNKVEGVWKKGSRIGRTKWFDENGEEIKLKPGKIWIEVVNQRGGVGWE